MSKRQNVTARSESKFDFRHSGEAGLFWTIGAGLRYPGDDIVLLCAVLDLKTALLQSTQALKNRSNYSAQHTHHQDLLRQKTLSELSESTEPRSAREGPGGERKSLRAPPAPGRGAPS